jgi:hypothetical protein
MILMFPTVNFCNLKSLIAVLQSIIKFNDTKQLNFLNKIAFNIRFYLCCIFLF